ncbi:hypothetical protein B9Z19DRAFT_1064509 [Tuber borchii]|uniref:Secreted protein n=1 Tax=Tuber borchii TaxID=42251 RepID=A0A2T6ZUJ0_TUBBO|nr:hypothetical protein B9Z19DRAFT_1064509 [Tuber borchii]
MGPFAIIIAISLAGQFTVAYPLGASGGASPPSPTHNSKIQRVSAGATPTPSGSPLPDAKRLPELDHDMYPEFRKPKYSSFNDVGRVCFSLKFERDALRLAPNLRNQRLLVPKETGHGKPRGKGA